jgi:hypothetical protein
MCCGVRSSLESFVCYAKVASHSRAYLQIKGGHKKCCMVCQVPLGLYCTLWMILKLGGQLHNTDTPKQAVVQGLLAHMV